MPHRKLSLDVAPSVMFTNTEKRTIAGLALPTGETTDLGMGKPVRFLPDSVTFDRENIPLLAYHDASRPVGKLVAYEWTDLGMAVSFKVSATAAGDEILQLASDGVLGLSVGVMVPESGWSRTDTEFHVTNSTCVEISVTPTPAFAGASIDHVSLSSEGGLIMPEIQVNTDDTVANMAESVVSSLTEQAAPEAAQQLSRFARGPVEQPVPRAVVTRSAPIYAFQGGNHRLIADLTASSRGDGEATERLNRHLKFAIESGDLGAVNPSGYRADLYVDTIDPDRPLSALVSTGTLTDQNPFVVPKYVLADETNLVNPHVEGVEPTLGGVGVTSQTITPGAVSGKVAITREAWDMGGNPQLDAIVWRRMVAAAARAEEERIVAMLDDLVSGTDPGEIAEIALTEGTPATAAAELQAALVGLHFQAGGNRYNAMALNQAHYTSLASAKDSTGRPLFPVLGPTNANGQMESGFGRLVIGNAVGVPVAGLSSYSYLFDRSSVWSWTSAARRFTFDIQIAVVYIGLFQYHAGAVLDESGIKRIA